MVSTQIETFELDCEDKPRSFWERSRSIPSHKFSATHKEYPPLVGAVRSALQLEQTWFEQTLHTVAEKSTESRYSGRNRQQMIHICTQSTPWTKLSVPPVQLVWAHVHDVHIGKQVLELFVSETDLLFDLQVNSKAGTPHILNYRCAAQTNAVAQSLDCKHTQKTVC